MLRDERFVYNGQTVRNARIESGGDRMTSTPTETIRQRLERENSEIWEEVKEIMARQRQLLDILDRRKKV